MEIIIIHETESTLIITSVKGGKKRETAGIFLVPLMSVDKRDNIYETKNN